MDLVSFSRERVKIMGETRSCIPKSWCKETYLPPAFLSVYGLSSWTFAALGIWIFLRFDKPLFPGMFFEAALCILQSVTSFGCDVQSFGRASIWKPLDRLMASFFTLWQVLKFFWLGQTRRERLMWGMAISVALYCFYQAQAALRTRPKPDFRAFLRWHSLWHLSLPLGAAIWCELRCARLLLQSGSDS